MRHLLALLFAWLLLCPAAWSEDAAPPEAAQPGAFLPGTPTWAELVAQSKASSKPILIDFSTTWCGWCKKLDAEVFPEPEVIAALSAFVCAHIDAEKGEGPDLAKRYDVHGFPTLVIVDADGAEIDRLVGYSAPAAFVSEVQRIASGRGTLPALRKAVEADPENLSAAVALARREARSDRAQAERRLESVRSRAVAKPDAEAEAEACLALGAMAAEARQPERAIEQFAHVLRDLGTTVAAGRTARAMGTIVFVAKPADAFDLLERALAVAREPADRLEAGKLAYAWHQDRAAKALLAWGQAIGDDAEALNEVAWAAYLQRLQPKASIAWARRGVEVSKRSPAILDTLACLLFQMGAVDEAILLEEEALAKVTERGMKAEFEVNLAMWKAAREARKGQPEGIPATPLVPAPAR